MKTFGVILTLFITLFSIVSPATSDEFLDPDTLRVALLPDENASTIIKNNQGLKKYLENYLEKNIELVVTTDYSSMIEAMRFGRLELAYFGPLSYTLAAGKADIEAFASIKKRGALTYHSVIIAGVNTEINTLNDIKGKDVAFGDVASTSSHLIPRSELLDAGLEIKEDYSAYYLGAHDAVAVAVQNGTAHAGGLSKPIFESLVSRNIISEEKVKVIAVSPPYPNYPWSMQSNLKPELREKIKTAFYKLSDKSVLKAFKAEGFGAVVDSDYDIVRDLAVKLNLVK